MEIRFYGQLRENLGATTDLDPPRETETVGQLRDVLAAQFPETADLLRRSRACIADAMVADDAPLAGAATVEFLPPLSGG